MFDDARMPQRPRRNRASQARRDLVREAQLEARHLVLPLFVQESEESVAIASMPRHARLGIRGLVDKAREAWELGVRAVALFPALGDELKDPYGRESLNPEGLLQRATRAL